LHGLLTTTQLMKGSKSLERRGQERRTWPGDMPLELTLSEGTIDFLPQSFAVFGIDISSRGIGIHSPHPLNVSQLVGISVPSAVAEISVPLLAQVRWVKPTPKGSHRAGLYFLF